MCLVSNGSWEFTFATMDGNSRIPILVSLEVANSLAGMNVIYVASGLCDPFYML